VPLFIFDQFLTSERHLALQLLLHKREAYKTEAPGLTIRRYTASQAKPSHKTKEMANNLQGGIERMTCLERHSTHFTRLNQLYLDALQLVGVVKKNLTMAEVAALYLQSPGAFIALICHLKYTR
jgi:hypothetical protein